MKNKLKIIGITLIAGIVGACSTLTPAQQSAINTTANAIVIAAKTYQNIGEPGLPTQYQSLYNGLTSAAAQLQMQVGQPANPTVISTGTPAVDAAIVKVVTPAATVTQANVATLSAAAALVAPPAPAAAPASTPATSAASPNAASVATK